MLKSVASTVVLVGMIVVLTSAVTVAFRLYVLGLNTRRRIGAIGSPRPSGR